jgi:N-acetylmuramoyl-L-alanine amidase
MEERGMIAICIGHSRGDGGAASVDGMSEWAYNSRLGKLIVADLRERGFDVMLVDKYAQAGYGRAMQYLAANLKSNEVDVAVELHFNAASNAKATGHEWLYWHASGMGRKLAQCLDRRMNETFPEHKRRGLVPIREEERGGGFLQKLSCPAVICEPFFGSNANDWKLATAHTELLARVIADGIDDWKGGADE